jgi:hypothetical protein
VAPHLPLLLIGERPGLQKDEIVRADLADVMDPGGVADQLDLGVLEAQAPRESLGERGHTLRVSVGVRVAQVD